MRGATGDDDLRSDCHATLRVFLKANSHAIVFDPILGGQSSNKPFDTGEKDIGAVSSANDINSFQIEHVSVEHGTETRDNWDMQNVTFEFKVPGMFPQVIAESGFHRFTGDSAVLDIPVTPPS
jgi:hypothetical protein